MHASQKGNMIPATIDKQINAYLGQLDPKEKEVVPGIVKTFIENRHDNDLLGDKGYGAEKK
jgi:hypothetical protein